MDGRDRLCSELIWSGLRGTRARDGILKSSAERQFLDKCPRGALPVHLQDRASGFGVLIKVGRWAERHAAVSKEFPRFGPKTAETQSTLA